MVNPNTMDELAWLRKHLDSDGNDVIREARVWRLFRVVAGEGARLGRVFPLRGGRCVRLGLVDGGAVPVVGVDVERVEDPCLERGPAGDERDRAALRVEDDGADPVEFA